VNATKQIAAAFNSIRDDAQSMVNQLEDGKIDTLERMGIFWMKVTRETSQAVSNKIKKTYNEVTHDSRDRSIGS